MLRLVWHFIHLLVRFWYLGVVVANVIESCLKCSGLLKLYKAIDVGELQYLAIVVVESDDACQIAKAIQLLHWLEGIHSWRIRYTEMVYVFFCLIEAIEIVYYEVLDWISHVLHLDSCQPMPGVVQGQDPGENDKPAKNVVPEEPRNERHLDLDDCSNRCIYREAPETEPKKLDCSKRRIYHGTTIKPESDSRSEKSPVTASEPRQCKHAKPAEDGKSAKDINKVSCEVDEMSRLVIQFVFMSRLVVQFVFKCLNTLG
ncbi:hypothetical protein SADUNF_Sadunf09G0092600 [Salix dunnii]|uniref:Uncharacterized protein n=1 Tax=Salix dunnii TaxID=1413687 RepID=A0A835N059_9ROSI|nr:hypothetical protein SADUNF_Sadunf09G0092600 [Salix dunnii]